jgi:hypothetical protein
MEHTTMEVDATPLLNDCSLTVKLFTPALTSFRLWLGFKLMIIGAWILPCKCEVVDAT